MLFFYIIMLFLSYLRHNIFSRDTSSPLVLILRQQYFKNQIFITALTKMNTELLKCFAPIHNVLLFLGSSRLKIKNNMIAPSTRYQKLYALCCIFVVTLSFSYIQLYYYLTYYHEDTTIYVCYAIGIMVQNVSYLSHTIFARFLDVESSVKLCQNLQKVDNILRLEQFKRYNEQQYYWNVVVLVFIITSFECGFLVHIWYTVEYPILAFFAGIGLLNVYMELVLAASLIVYLAIRLKFLNKIAHHNLKIKGYYNNTRAAIAVDEHLLINSDVKDANIDLGNFLICMKEILKMYQHITQVFSFPVLNIATTVFIWTLLVMLTVVVGFCTKPLSLVMIITVSLLCVFYLALLTMVALVSDYFIKQVRKTKLYCIHAMSRRFEGPIWKGANEILKTIDFYQPSFSVFGIFILNKTLPLTIIGLITTNLAILIQFTMQV